MLEAADLRQFLEQRMERWMVRLTAQVTAA
jgi:hypothetical protein